MIRHASSADRRATHLVPDPDWVAGVPRRCDDRGPGATRATWQVWHLRAEAERQARAAGIGLADLDTAVDRVVDEALASVDPARYHPTRSASRPELAARRRSQRV